MFYENKGNHPFKNGFFAKQSNSSNNNYLNLIFYKTPDYPFLLIFKINQIGAFF